MNKYSCKTFPRQGQSLSRSFSAAVVRETKRYAWLEGSTHFTKYSTILQSDWFKSLCPDPGQILRIVVWHLTRPSPRACRGWGLARETSCTRAARPRGCTFFHNYLTFFHNSTKWTPIYLSSIHVALCSLLSLLLPLDDSDATAGSKLLL